ncbi:hypothetical protein X798_07680 [Onchocerca flexuosa]|uniref:Uncharacterized protein n=1 Tax=Onchocerca flexuosa TaxID=387005 RepID=A0A238BKD1_9BILA|nr:hypothetical protein X798_07680 [Onchocerca flexuosa]
MYWIYNVLSLRSQKRKRKDNTISLKSNKSPLSDFHIIQNLNRSIRSLIKGQDSSSIIAEYLDKI